MIHYSKKDGWLIGLVLAAILVPLVLGAFFFLAGGSGQKLGESLLVIGAVTAAAVLLLTYPLYYQVDSLGACCSLRNPDAQAYFPDLC